ncbi:MAG TPA: nitroreductase/quinone reductase family protein [Anaerolineales bacterium]|nr:nitroreductase/quinone reductase family protein [Anaerolineales bacterium]
MNGNGFISWVLRSPLHGILSHGMMLITVTGRKTGKKITLPVGYYCDEGSLWILTSRDRTWWRNVEYAAEVSLLLKRRLVRAFAEAALDDASVEQQMHEYIRHVPQAAKSLGVRVENGNANAEDISRVAKDRLFVKIHQIT